MKIRVKLGVSAEPSIIFSIEGELPNADFRSSVFQSAILDAIYSAKTGHGFLSFVRGQALHYQASSFEKKVLELVSIFLIVPAREGAMIRQMDSVNINQSSLNSVYAIPPDDKGFSGLLAQFDRIESGIITPEIVSPRNPNMPGKPPIQFPPKK